MARPRESSAEGSRGGCGSAFRCVWAQADERPGAAPAPRAPQALRASKKAAAAARSKGEKLCAAAYDGRVRDVRRLLDRGADVNYTCPDGRSVLISAFDFGIPCLAVNLEVVELLLKRGADVNAADVFGWSALHYAICLDDVPRGRCVDMLIAAGADVNARDKSGATPLHWAALKNREAIVRALLAAGADTHLVGWGGRFRRKTPADLTTRDAIRNLLLQ